MVTEEDFQEMMDKDPADFSTGLVFADWLEDRGDKRAVGYRVLTKLKKRPMSLLDNESICWWDLCKVNELVKDKSSFLPLVIGNKLPKKFRDVNFWPSFALMPRLRNLDTRRFSRRGCMNAAAKAIALLTNEEIELLLQKELE